MELKITDCLVTLEGLVTLLDAAAVYPTTDPADYQRMFGGLQFLATKAERQLRELEFTEAFKEEAPALRQQEPAPQMKKIIQPETTTKTPVPAIAAKYPEVVQLLKEGLSVKAIAEKTNLSVSQIYKVKSEVF